VVPHLSGEQQFVVLRQPSLPCVAIRPHLSSTLHMPTTSKSTHKQPAMKRNDQKSQVVHVTIITDTLQYFVAESPI